MDWMEVSGKTVDDAINEGLISLGIMSDKIEYEIVERGSSGFLGIGSKPAIIKVRKKQDTNEEVLRKFLSEIFRLMNTEVDVTIVQSEDEKTLSVDLRGEGNGIVIGKRGQTLDALQYLANLAVNRSADKYTKVKIDMEDYRKRRRETLENLAKNISYKVKRTRRPVALEPMNPYERRIIHYALQGDKFITTHSEGEEPYRHVVIALKKNR